MGWPARSWAQQVRLASRCASTACHRLAPDPGFLASAVGLALFAAHGPQDEWWDSTFPADRYPAPNRLKRAVKWFRDTVTPDRLRAFEYEKTGKKRPYNVSIGVF